MSKEIDELKAQKEKELAEYDANVRKYRDLWLAETDEDKKAEYYDAVHEWAHKANAIIKFLHPRNYESIWWDI